jgi:hypothetical protein
VEAQIDQFHLEGEALGIEVEEEATLRLVDTYSTEDGRRTLARRFENARMNCSRDSKVSDPNDFDRSAISPIEGRSVKFVHDDESRRYEPTVDDRLEDVGGIVRALVGEIEMEGFLPGDDQSLDGVWEVDAKTVSRAFSPAGDLGFDCRSKELMLDTLLDENRTGVLIAYVDDSKTRPDELTIQISGNLASTARTVQGIEVGQRNELVVAETAYVHGTLSWNRVEECFEKLDLVADLDIQVLVSGPEPEGGIAPGIPGTYTFAGSRRIVATRESE